MPHTQLSAMATLRPKQGQFGKCHYFFPYEKEQKTDGISGNKTSQNHHYKTLTIVDNFQRFLASKLSARPLEVV